MTEPTHGEILRAIGVMEGKLEQLLIVIADQGRERSSLGERVGRLENRMAQVVILAVVAALVSPLVWSEVSHWIHSQPPATQERHQ